MAFIWIFRLFLFEQKNEKNTISLNDRMDNIATKYGGIWQLNEHHISDLEKRIDIDEQMDKLYNGLVVKTRFIS